MNDPPVAKRHIPLHGVCLVRSGRLSRAVRVLKNGQCCFGTRWSRRADRALRPFVGTGVTALAGDGQRSGSASTTGVPGGLLRGQPVVNRRTRCRRETRVSVMVTVGAGRRVSQPR